MIAPTAEGLVKKYQQVTGRPVLTPKWLLGWHQCRWGYTHLSDLNVVKNSYEQYNIPLDVIWSDIDHMDSYKQFTIDQRRYKGLGDFVKQINKEGFHYMNIVDAAIARRPGQDYEPYNSGSEKKIFIMAPGGKEEFIAQVWPVWSVYPDWQADQAIVVPYWHEHFKQWLDLVPFSGTWLDMNEPANFCHGVCF